MAPVGQHGEVTEEKRPVEQAVEALVNAQLGWRDPVSKLDVSLGVFNLFDAPYSYIQPYDGEHSPMPAEPREIAARVSMGF